MRAAPDSVILLQRDSLRKYPRIRETADMNRMGDPYYHPSFDCLSTGGSIVNYNICHPKFNERGTKSNQSKGNK
jgi:hypothetical protein